MLKTQTQPQSPLFRTRGLAALLVCLTAFAAGCGDDQDPEGAAALLEQLRADDYQSWERAPGYESKRASNTAHGDEVLIYVNDVVSAALAGGKLLTAWPEDSLIVKDSFDGDQVDLIAAMEKRDGQWYWAEWDGDGESIYSGDPETCTDCHQAGQDYVQAFGLPNDK